jgi:hypothetical protein
MQWVGQVRIERISIALWHNRGDSLSVRIPEDSDFAMEPMSGYGHYPWVLKNCAFLGGGFGVPSITIRMPAIWLRPAGESRVAWVKWKCRKGLL